MQVTSLETFKLGILGTLISNGSLNTKTTISLKPDIDACKIC
jgi:hypothetical protein